MRDVDGLNNAFGKADDGFKNNVYHTLNELTMSEGRKPLKKTGLKLIVAITVLCLLAAGTAFAVSNTWGILDFLSERRINVNVLSDAPEIVQTNPPQTGGESELAVFSVREAIFDGQNVYIVMEAKPTSPDYLLLGTSVALEEPIGNMGPLFEHNGETVGEYALNNNKTPIHTDVHIDMKSYSIDSILEADGTLIYMISGSFIDDSSQMALDITCITAPYIDGSALIENIQRSALTVELRNSGTQNNVVTNVNTAEYADCGVRVDRITLTGSLMGIYAEIEFLVIDEEIFAKTNGGLWFEFIDENGDRLPDGSSEGGGKMVYVQSSAIIFLRIQCCSKFRRVFVGLGSVCNSSITFFSLR